MNDSNARNRTDEAPQLSTKPSGNSPGVALAQASATSAYTLDPVVATQVGIAIDNARNSVERERRSKWGPPANGPRQMGTHSPGSGAGNCPSNNGSQVNVSALLEAIKANTDRHRYYDGQIINQRGGIDNINKDAVPQDFSHRSEWIEKQEFKLTANGSGIRMLATDETMLSVRVGQEFTLTDAVQRQFTAEKVFKFPSVFNRQGCDQTFNLTDLNGTDCLVRIPKRIWLLLCEGVYGAIRLNIPRELRFLHQNVEPNDAPTLLHNIRFMVNDIAATPIDLLNARLQKLSCPNLGEYQTVRSDLTELIKDWEEYRDLGSIEERDCKSTKEWKGIIANLFHDICPGIRQYINSPDNVRRRIDEVLAECDASVITRTQEALFAMENKGNLSMASVNDIFSHYVRQGSSTGKGAGWSNSNRLDSVIHRHFHNYGGKGNNAGKNGR